ncbi:O-antigen ligase [Capnocytophaga haemolytica]|jgi:membrane protein|uniref:Lipid A core - O-antigen ligase and related enzymes n=1 Tax=Capnocytophaga haemolytica TaxID=45243 RepID=A0AAX2GXL0_9FLAO|nr:O-antigen ligase family protein [Capnocytophaga haemolytica]AMD84557.1 hypothetical protein AXF12_02880 [Capnocytophaga haemolytica]SFN99198.1 O-antigen ligase [Capnocytophaga haemolytica]SNV09338.1 Lipid A core - O-antigen ligase and related enzymes [Capnocytophaga haemolytica]
MKSVIKYGVNYLPVVCFLIFLIANVVYIHRWRDLWIILPLSLSIEFIYNKRWQSFKWEAKHWYLCIVLLYFSLFYLHLPFEKLYYRSWVKILERNNAYLLLLVFCGFLGFGKEHKLSYYLNTLIVVAVLSVLYIVCYKIGLGNFIAAEDKTWVFANERIASVNHHMKYNMYLNLALIGIWYLVSRGYQRMRWWLISYYVLCFAILFYILSITEGRNGFLMCLITLIFIVVIETWKRNKWLSVVCLVGVLIVAGLLFAHNKRLDNNHLKEEPRLFLFKVAKEMIKEKPLLGWGANEGQYFFTQHRMAHPECEYYNGHFLDSQVYPYTDSHSQYLQTLIVYGTVGLAVLLATFTMPFFITRKKQLAFLIIALVATQSATQMLMIDESIPIFIYGIWFLLFFTDDILLPKGDKATS